jgi:tellurite resistance protein TehA-like permease
MKHRLLEQEAQAAIFIVCFSSSFTSQGVLLLFTAYSDPTLAMVIFIDHEYSFTNVSVLYLVAMVIFIDHEYSSTNVSVLY